MTSLHRVVIAWGGTAVVGQSVTVLHYSASDNASPPVAAIKAAFDTHLNLFPTGTTIAFPSSGDTIDDTTGHLIGQWVVSTGAGTSTGTGGAAAAGVGACIAWSTGGIVNGKKGPRKLRGRTFLVPLSLGAYGPDGTLADSIIPYINDVATGLQGAGPLAIWHRPTTPGGSDGNSYGVGAHKIRDKVAFLSSRRD